MKENYISENYIGNVDRYILVDNYFNENAICNFGYLFLIQIMRAKDRHSIGVWKIKNKKS